MTDPTERLLQTIRSALAARTLTRLEPVTRVEAALAAYKRAVEGQVISEFVSQHSLPSQHLAGDRKATAEALLAQVLALPELSARGDAGAVPVAPIEPPVALDSGEVAPASVVAPSSGLPGSAAAGETVEGAPVQPIDWGPLVRCVMRGPLVVVGGVARMERVSFAPREVRDSIEWIDTTRHGTHAIGNLAQRIRARRVGALVMMEGLVGHRHSEPVVDAARAASIPLAYAGKGGRNSLARAFLALIQRATADEER